MPAPRIEITYCTRCNFLARATWMAQELLQTFGPDLGEVAVIPGSGGIFEITLDAEVIATNRNHAPMPDPSHVKRLLRDRIAPDKKIGHD